MSEPITWRNVAGPNPANALRPLQAAQQSFTDSLGSLEKMLLNAQQQATNIENRKLDDTEQQYRTFLDSFTNPDDLLAARAEQQQRFQSLDPRIQARVREADEQRFGSLADMRIKELAISDDTRKRNEEPIRDNVLVNAYDGKFQEARQLLVDNPNIRNRAELMKSIDDAEKNKTRFSWEENNQKGTQAERELRLRVGRQQEQDNNASRALADEMARRVGDYRNQQRIVGEQYGNLAKELNYPEFITPSGRLDTELISKVTNPNSPAYDTKMVARIEALKTVAGRRGLNSMDTLMTSDTQAADRAFEEMSKSGKYRPAILEQARETFRTGYNSGPTALVGQDKARFDRILAERQVEFEDKKALDWSMPNSPHANDMFKRLEPELKNLINLSDGNTPEADIPYVRQKVQQVIREGIDVGGRKVVPSEAILRAAIQAADGGWWTDGQRGRKFIDKLTEMLKSDDMLEASKTAEEVDAKDREYRIKNAMRAGK